MFKDNNTAAVGIVTYNPYISEKKVLYALNLNNIRYYILSLWLFLMMAIPAVSSYIKLVTLLLLVVMQVSFYGVKYYRFMAKACIAWIMFFLLTFVVSAINSFPFSLGLFEVYILRPIFFMLLMPIISERKSLYFMIKTLIYISLFIAVYNVIMILQALRIIPIILDESTLYGIEKVPVTIVSEAFFTSRSTNQTALMFLTPFMLVINLKKDSFPQHLQKLIKIATILCIMASIGCGRRILQLETLIAIIALSFLKRYTFRKKVKLRHIISIIIMFVCILFFIMCNLELVNAVGKTLFSIFDEVQTNKARTTQVPALLDLWKQSPLIGNGISSFSRNVIRSATDPYSYEYFYIALLAQTGIIGISMVTLYVINIIKRLSTYYKKCDDFENIFVIATIFGFLGFLFCGLSNPLVTSSWMWFIVLSVYYYCISNENNAILRLDFKDLN